jgi:hypothetical protein
MLLIDEKRLDERRKAVQGPLAPLFASLSAELEPLLGRELHIPKAKALLSRAGGRCERDSVNLEFDPFSPDAHRCPVCGTVYRGELHDRAWNTWYHLWLAERAVHASLFHVLVGDARHITLARDILREYAEVYLTYPNRDNVLGPTRPFFSTYLESIWLLQLCVAADLVEQGGDSATADIVRERIVTPSRDLIAGFIEGNSNRQVWNNAALMASALLLGDKERADQVVRVKSGVARHLQQAVLPDGTWFEGDNYHQFAVRGLWYAVTMCDANGLDLAAEQSRRFDRAVSATFVSALPDFTFPSRKDSQYAVSLRQWRFAELAELGFARSRDEQLGGALARCYEPGLERRDTGRARSTADAERNTTSSLLTRADLGWRALIHALPQLPAVEPPEPRSVHLTGQGLAVFRRRGQVYVAMDYGQSGAGHGHPDRLNLLLSQGDTRWLDDLGTGSYVERSLHWYRSSLAHNAPFVNGKSQQSADGRLLAYDERGDLGWVEAQFMNGDVKLTRTIVVMPGYVVDELAWSAPTDVQVDVPWHVSGDVNGVTLAPAAVEGGDGLEDGFDFARDWKSATMPRGEPVTLTSQSGARSLRITLSTKTPAKLCRAEAPSQPSSRNAPFYMVRLRGAQGRLRCVMAWDPSAVVGFDGEDVVVESGTTRDVHSRTAAGWRVENTVNRATKTHDLAGKVANVVPTPRLFDVKVVGVAKVPRLAAAVGGWWSDLTPAQRDSLVAFQLDDANYRRSEDSWADAGSPTARIGIAAVPGGLEFLFHVHAKNQRFAAASAENPFDNEHADTMGAGVQLYVGTDAGRIMLMLVPEQGSSRVRVREIAGSVAASVEARWRQHETGYEMHVLLNDKSINAFTLDVVINDANEGRDRRRGQLVLTAARSEFVYLRGDREDTSRSLRFEVSR